MSIFFLSIINAFILQSKGIVKDPLIEITILGICQCLLVFAQNIKMNLEYAISAPSWMKKRILIEGKHTYPVRLFRIFENNKTSTYQGNLLRRSVLFVFIGLSRLPGTVFPEKMGIWVIVTATSLIAIELQSFTKHYVKVLRKVVLGVRK